MLQAEEHVRALEGIEDVAIEWDGRAISEIHVVSSSSRAPRLISRDVESVLKARGIRVDHKTISVAQVKPGNSAKPSRSRLPREPENGAAAVAPFELPAFGAAELPESPGTNGAPAPEPQPSPEQGLGQILRLEPEEATPRLRFKSVNVTTVGLKAHARVELLCGGSEVLGSASGTNSRLGAPRLVATAVLDALKQLVTEDVDFSLEALDFPELGGTRLALVAVACLEDRHQWTVYGTAAVDGESNQAVVAATLDALNRTFGRFRQRDTVEYELRPTHVEV